MRDLSYQSGSTKSRLFVMLVLNKSHGGAAAPPYPILVGRTCRSAVISRKPAPRRLRPGRTPTAFRPPAQGWRTRAYLGNRLQKFSSRTERMERGALLRDSLALFERSDAPRSGNRDFCRDLQRGCVHPPAQSCRNSVGTATEENPLPRVASRTRQPWALLQNAVGVPLCAKPSIP